MYFDSLHAMLVMEGHGVYVWVCYCVTALVIGVLLVVPVRRRKQLLVQLAAEQRRAQRAAPTPEEG